MLNEKDQHTIDQVAVNNDMKPSRPCILESKYETPVYGCPRFLYPTKLGVYLWSCIKCSYYHGNDGTYIRCHLKATSGIRPLKCVPHKYVLHKKVCSECETWDTDTGEKLLPMYGNCYEAWLFNIRMDSTACEKFVQRLKK